MLLLKIDQLLINLMKRNIYIGVSMDQLLLGGRLVMRLVASFFIIFFSFFSPSPMFLLVQVL